MIHIDRILCPIDFSQSSRCALARACRLAAWYQCRVEVLHVAPSMPIGPVLTAPAGPVFAWTPEEFAATVRDFVDLDPGVALESTVTYGDAVTGILTAARNSGADLIALGTHGRTSLRNRGLGSVTGPVMRQAPCPVLAVPAAGSGEQSAGIPFRHILCPADFSQPSMRALEYALSLGQEAQGLVSLLHVLPLLPDHESQSDHAFSSVDDVRLHLEEEVRDRLQALQRTHGPGVKRRSCSRSESRREKS